MHRTPSERRSRVAQATTGVFCTLLTLLFALIGPGCGGGTRGTNISGTGTVRTAIGEPVSGATVSNTDNSRTVITDGAGNFQLRVLALEPDEPASLTVTTDNNEYSAMFIPTSDSGKLEVTLPPAGQPPIAEAVFTPNSPVDDSSTGEDSREDNSPEDDSSFEPQPTPTPETRPGNRPTPSPSRRPTRPTPSPSGSGGGNNANPRILAGCVDNQFTVRGIPDLSCEQPCLNDPGSYVTDCRNFISYLSQVFLPYCANDPCADECELTQLLFPDTRTGYIVAQGYQNANCDRSAEERGEAEQRGEPEHRQPANGS